MTLTEQHNRHMTIRAYGRLIQQKRDEGDHYAAQQFEKTLRELEAKWAQQDEEQAA